MKSQTAADELFAKGLAQSSENILIWSQEVYGVLCEFNIHFGYPRSDTCDVCDSLKLQMEQASESEKAALQKEHEDHLALAKCGYDTLCYDQNLSKESWEAQMQHSSDPNN